MKQEDALKLAAAEHPAITHEDVKRILDSYFAHWVMCPACEDGQVELPPEGYELSDGQDPKIKATRTGKITCPRCNGTDRDSRTTFWYCEHGKTSSDGCNKSYGSEGDSRSCGWAVVVEGVERGK